MSAARDLVMDRLMAQARKFPELDFAPLETANLDGRDAALAMALDHAVARRWLTLATIVESRLSRPWEQLETKLQAALLCGAAQLLLLERVPDHAAINETVEWSKLHVRAKAGGLVNAVLRKIAALRRERGSGPAPAAATLWGSDQLPLEDGRVWKLTEPVFAEDPLRRTAQQTSHPESLIAHWLNSLGQEKAFAVAAHDVIQAPIIVHGLDERQSSANLTPHDEPGFFIFDGERGGLSQLLEKNPNAIVQDPTSAAPANATATLTPRPRTIIDACAGRGTKTRQLALLHLDARIIATDIDESRLAALQRQFAGHPQVEVVQHRDIRRFDGQADLLFLDVPCSNTGVLARRVEAKYRFNTTSLKKLIDVQRQIIADSLPLLSNRGRLLYSTCSIEAAENEQQAQWITKWHSFHIAQSHGRLPSGLPAGPSGQYTDGGYFAILQRRGS